MALDASNVAVAITGAWYGAPVGTTGPTGADSTLDQDFVDYGYLSNDGTTKSVDRSSSDIIAWQNNDKVRSVITESGVTFSFTLIESKPEVIELYTGAKMGVDGSFEVHPGSTGGRKAFVFDVVDNGSGVDEFQRFYIPEGEVTEVGDQVFSNSGDAIGYEITVAAYASATINGASYKYWNSTLVES